MPDAALPLRFDPAAAGSLAAGTRQRVPARARRRPWAVIPAGRYTCRPTERTVLVGVGRAGGRASVAHPFGPVCLAEPCDRGTAVTVLRAAHWVQWRDPEGILAFLPGAAIAKSEERGDELASSLAAVAAFVQKDPRWVLLLERHPPEGGDGRGGIEPGGPLGRIGREPFRIVRRFRERRNEATDGADVACAVVARASTVVHLGRRCLFEMSDALAQAARFAGRVEESWLLRSAYASAPSLDLVPDLLTHALPFVAIGRLRTVDRRSH